MVTDNIYRSHSSLMFNIKKKILYLLRAKTMQFYGTTDFLTFI